jgi:hypothetical protein
MQVNKIVRIYSDPIPNPSPISQGAMVAARLLPAGHRLLGEGKGVAMPTSGVDSLSLLGEG